MKKLLYLPVAALIAVAATSLAGCSSQPKGSVSVNPEVAVLAPNVDNDVDLGVSLNIPRDYISSRSMATIQPVLILDNQVVREFKPITVYGKIYKKKAERVAALHGSKFVTKDPLMLADSPYGTDVYLAERIHLDKEFDSGRVEAYITTDGCGECYGVDTIDVAYLSNLSTLIDTENMMVQWIDTVLPPNVKSFSGEGEARLQFEVNKYDILPHMANNAAEMDAMLQALTPVLTDSLSTLNSMSIFGSASAEGIYKKNVALAENRANAAKEWLDRNLKLKPYQRRLIKIGSRPEGWGPVIASMHAAGDADSALVKQIVEKYPDLKTGEAERHIRKLKCWPRIAEKHLAKDRRVIYTYEWTIKSFDTDEEALDMFKKRPDALSVPEFLRVARMMDENLEGDDAVINVYETMLRYKPGNDVGVNNLAVLYVDNGRYNDAIRLLESQPQLTDLMTNTLAVCYKEIGDIDTAIQLLEGANTGQARANLGSLLASTHRMAQAYPYLKDAADLNTAIAALGINDNREAWRVLQRLDDDSPRADYVRAITQARLGDKELSLKYLERAVQDEKLKARAASEADFVPLHSEARFFRIIQD